MCGRLGLKGPKGKTYLDHRDETVAPWPFGHTTVSGLSVMPPPQLKPTQPSDAGAMICRSVSNAVFDDALSGTAMRNTGTVGPHEYSK